MCARLFCLLSLLGLAACRRERHDVTSIITEPRCPSFAKVPEPDDDGDCRCATGFWPYSRLISGGVEMRSSYFFEWDCADCLCIPYTPDIEIRGEYVFLKAAGRIVVKRQGKTLTEMNLSGDAMNYSLADFLHQEVVVSAFAPACDEGGICSKYGVGFVEKPVFPHRSNLCGVGLFTKDRLFCSKLGVAGSSSVAQNVTATMDALRASKVIDRGFGLEFELVSRSVPKHLRDAVKAKNAFKFRFQGAAFNGIMSLTRWYLQRQNETAVLGSLKKYGFSDMDSFLEKTGALDLPALEECFVNSTKSPEDIGTPCSKHSDCALTQYCMDCAACKKQKSRMLPVKAWEAAKSWLALSGRSFLPDVTLCNGCPSGEAKVCQKRSECEDGLPAGGGACPTALKKWQWTLDPSVHALSEAAAKQLSPHGDREDEGAGFELVSPPLAGEEGMRSALEVLQVLRGMGIQAGTSSGMHVHVNVASSKVPGTILSPTKIANVWVIFAKYQLVIDEMLSPSRLGNHYARRLFLGQCSGNEDGVCSDENPCHCSRRFFKQIHAYVHDAKQLMTGTVGDFCNAALANDEEDKPCDARYPDVRYYALNLVPLTRLGTIEFRAHSATHDPERLQRWTQFVVAFVEHFGVDMPSAAKPFFDGNAEEDLAELAEAQKDATSDELFEALKDKLSPGFKEYFASRPWEDEAPGCDVTEESSLDEQASLESFRKDRGIAKLLGEQISAEVEPGPDGDE